MENKNKEVYVIIMENGNIYDNKAYTNRDHAMRIFDILNDGSKDNFEYCLHVKHLPFIGRTLSYIHEDNPYIDPLVKDTYICTLSLQHYYRNKIFACEVHAKESEVWSKIKNNPGVSIQHIRAIKN